MSHPPNVVERAMDRLARLILGHRLLFVLGTILVTALAGWVGLRIRADFSVQELFASGDPEIAYLREFEQQFGPDEDGLLILIDTDDVFRRDVLEYVGRLTREAARKRALFRRVDSLTTLSDLGNTEEGGIDTRPLFETIPSDPARLAALRKRAVESPLLGGRIVSRDGTLTVLALRLQHGLKRARDLERVSSAAEKLVAGLERPAGVTVRFSGVPYVRTEAVRLVKNDQTVFLPLGCAITSLLLILLYRSVYEVAVPMISISLSAGYTVSLMAAFDAPIDILSNVLPLLVMVYGVADAVHLMGRIHEQMRAGGRGEAPPRAGAERPMSQRAGGRGEAPPRAGAERPMSQRAGGRGEAPPRAGAERPMSPRAGEGRDLAIRTAMRHLGVACLLTSVTTSIGFASLVTGSMTILPRFGLFAAAGVMLAYVTTMVVTPLGVSLRRRHPAMEGRTTLRWLDLLLAGVAEVSVNRPRLLLLVGVIVVGGAVALGSQVEVNNYLLGIYREGHPTTYATRLAERKLEGVVQMQVSLVGKPGQMKDPRVLEAMHRLEVWLGEQPQVTTSLSLATFLREMHRVVVGRPGIPESRRGVAELLLMSEGEERVNRFVDYPYGRARVLIGCRDIGARQFLPLAARVDRRAKRIFAPVGVRARVTGTGLVAYRGINRLVLDLLTSLSLAFVVIAIVLALVFRSLRIGLVSLIPNVMPLAVGLGFMTLAGIRLEPATVIVFSIALGIAVDDTIHFFSRYREEVQGGRAPEDAVRKTMATAGRAMVFTSLVLMSGFSVTFASNFRGTANFGLVGIVIFTTALWADLLVTPACLLVFRPWSRR